MYVYTYIFFIHIFFCACKYLSLISTRKGTWMIKNVTV